MIVIRADGNGKIGMGHIGRCLPIAKSVQNKGVEVLWLTSRDSDINSIQNKSIKVIRCGEDSDTVLSGELKKMAVEGNIDCVLIDSYFVKPSDFDFLSQYCRVYYLDDLNLFDYNVSGVINYNFEAKETNYKTTRFVSRKLLLGPGYFPLKEDLKRNTPIEIRCKVKNVLLTTGSTDSCNVIEKILESIKPTNFPDIDFNVLVGLWFDEKYKERIFDKFATDKNVKFIPWGQNIVELYKSCDLMIAPGATMIYEAMYLGIPCISFMFVENQRAQCEEMQEIGLVPYIGNLKNEIDERKISSAFKKTLDFEYRKDISRRSIKLIDGAGAAKIASVLIGG